MATSAELRRDLTIARSLGVSFGEFMGETNPRFDNWERTLWRAFHYWESGLCPGCGQPRSKSLFDSEKERQTRYQAGFVRCLSCEKLLRDQDNHRIEKQKKHRPYVEALKLKHPEDAPSLISGHEHWQVWELEPEPEQA